jgi:hypothetical protein
MHPAAAMGTPMCGRDGPSACSADDERHQREDRLQVGFGRIYALFLARYTPCFWLKYTPKRRFWKTRRLIQGIFFGCITQGVYFYYLRSVMSTPGGRPAALGPSRTPWGISDGRGCGRGHISALVFLSTVAARPGRPSTGRGPLVFKTPPYASCSPSDRSWGS